MVLEWNAPFLHIKIKKQQTELLTGFRCEVDAKSGDGVLCRVSVQLRHQQVVVLHPQRELLHV